jgi:hypothetical protein
MLLVHYRCNHDTHTLQPPGIHSTAQSRRTLLSARVEITLSLTTVASPATTNNNTALEISHDGQPIHDPYRFVVDGSRLSSVVGSLWQLLEGG